jgi:multidrug efflux pump subunit AcrA (membrane-fusion protein)
MQKSLFRQEAMDKTLSPDELDLLMRVASPRGWLALIALFALLAATVVWGIFGTVPIVVSGNDGVLLGGDSRLQVVSQASGLVTEVRMEIGDRVQEGQVLARVRLNDGAETDVVSLFDGRVDSVLIEKGMLLDRGQNVAVVKEGSDPLQAFVFVSAQEGKRLQKGMRAQISPSTVKTQQYGFMQGEVVSVSKFPVTEDEMFLLLENQSLVDSLRTQGESQLEVRVELQRGFSTPSGYEWSSSQGPPFAITRGTLCTASFVLGEQHPMDLVLPSSAR